MLAQLNRWGSWGRNMWSGQHRELQRLMDEECGDLLLQLSITVKQTTSQFNDFKQQLIISHNSVGWCAVPLFHCWLGLWNSWKIQNNFSHMVVSLCWVLAGQKMMVHTDDLLRLCLGSYAVCFQCPLLVKTSVVSSDSRWR